jgi:hypothetical protein
MYDVKYTRNKTVTTEKTDQKLSNILPTLGTLEVHLYTQRRMCWKLCKVQVSIITEPSLEMFFSVLKQSMLYLILKMYT